MSIVGLYANLADFQPRALDIRVQISAAPCFDSERGERVRIQDRYTNFRQRSQASLAQQTAELGNAALTTQSQLNYYSAQIEAHAKAIVKLNKVLDKLDRVLSQRKLNEFKGSDTRSEAQNRYKSGSHEE